MSLASRDAVTRSHTYGHHAEGELFVAMCQATVSACQDAAVFALLVSGDSAASPAKCRSC